MKDLKYITWEDADGLPQFVLFPQTIQHIDMWLCIRSQMLNPVADPTSAGFVTLIGDKWQTHGFSDSLEIGPHPADFDTLNQ